MQVFRRLWFGLLSYRFIYLYTVVLLVSALMVYTAQARVVIRFQNRSLLIYNSEPAATTKYVVSLTYTTQTTVGSLDMEFCIDPIPYNPCVAPAGLDLSGAVLSDQVGETGYSMDLVSPNHIILSRTPAVVGQTPSSYTFDNIVNPTFMSHSFSIRLSDYASTDATGPIIDLGSVVTQIQEGVLIATQVPPILVFCVQKIVDNNCNSNSGGNYQDLGDINDDDLKTLYTTSQMGAGTNATAGYSITVHGTTMAAGTYVIEPLTTPTLSAPGNSQFGINLVENTSPLVGHNPDGSSVNAVVSANYDIPNRFMYNDGDEVASAPNVSLVRRFTVSYLINTPPKLRAGVYTTTLTFICTGRF